MANPLEQFKVKPLVDINVGGLDFSFTNSAMFMVLAAVLSILLISTAIKRLNPTPNRGQGMAEMLYQFVSNIVTENAGQDAKRFVPLITTTFVFILFSNLLGMIPIGFTVTSHVVINFIIALVLFVVLIAYGFYKHGVKFFGLFWPHGMPAALSIFIFILEFISFLIRPFSLAIRLCANMVAGHVLLKVVAGFCVSLVAYSGVLSGEIGVANGLIGVIGTILSFIFLILMVGIEFFVAILQAYIFVMLASIYLNDAVNMH